MNNLIRNYETFVIADPQAKEKEIDAILEKISNIIGNYDGKISDVQKWGRRKLAYEIKDRTEGNYTLIYFSSDVNALPELRRFYELNELILRTLIVLQDESNAKSASKSSNKSKPIISEEMDDDDYDDDDDY